MNTTASHRTPPLVRLLASSCLTVALLAVPARCLGHGSPFVVDYLAATNTISVSPSVYQNFDVDENLASPGFGFPITTIYPGFSRASTLPANSTVRIRFTSPLVYWNPATAAGSPLPMPAGTITVVDAAAATAAVAAGGVTGSNPLPVGTFTGSVGEHHHFTAYELTAPDAAGLYGLWAEATATGPAYPGGQAAASDPFLIVLNWDIQDAAQYQAGVARLSSSVPEPALAAVTVAAAGLIATGWRRRASFTPAGRDR